MILLLVGYILYGAGTHIVKVEDDFQKMEELKVGAEAADIAKSQVLFLAYCYHLVRLISSFNYSPTSKNDFFFYISVSSYCLS